MHAESCIQSVGSCHQVLIQLNTTTYVSNSAWLTIIMASVVMMISAIIPIILAIMFVKYQEKLRMNAKCGTSNPKLIYLLQKYRLIKMQYATFIWIEVGLETYYQASGQILLLLLSITETPTTGGF